MLAAKVLFRLLDILYGRKRTLYKFKILELMARVPIKAGSRSPTSQSRTSRSAPGLPLSSRGEFHFHLGDEQFWRDRQGTADEDACLRRSRMSTSIAFARASPAVEFGTGR